MGHPRILPNPPGACSGIIQQPHNLLSTNRSRRIVPSAPLPRAEPGRRGPGTAHQHGFVSGARQREPQDHRTSFRIEIAAGGRLQNFERHGHHAGPSAADHAGQITHATSPEGPTATLRRPPPVPSALRAPRRPPMTTQAPKSSPQPLRLVRRGRSRPSFKTRPRVAVAAQPRLADRAMWRARPAQPPSPASSSQPVGAPSGIVAALKVTVPVVQLIG